MRRQGRPDQGTWSEQEERGTAAWRSPVGQSCKRFTSLTRLRPITIYSLTHGTERTRYSA